jgi:hypothetical protein
MQYENCGTNMIILVRDIEMGLLHSSTSSLTSEDEADTLAQISPLAAAEHRHNLHEVIGDVLELFSRTLRAHH